MDERRRMSKLGSKIPTKEDIESKLDASPPPSSGLMGGLGGGRLNSGLGSGLSGGLGGGLTGGLNSNSPIGKSPLHNKPQEPGLGGRRGGGFIGNVKPTETKEDGDENEDDALYSYTPTRKSKEYIEKNKSTFSNASKNLPNKPKKDEIDEEDVEIEAKETPPREETKTKGNRSNRVVSQQDTPSKARDKVNKENVIEGSKNIIISLADKIKITFVCIGLILIVYYAVQHIVVQQLYNPTTYSEEMNPITRLVRTIRGEDTRNLYYED